MGRRGYPPEFRRKVLDLSVADVAHDPEISEQSIYTWRHQERIDRGLVGGLTRGEKAELTAANKRIADLEDELALSRRAVELLRGGGRPKRRFAAADVMAAEDLLQGTGIGRDSRMRLWTAGAARTASSSPWPGLRTTLEAAADDLEKD